MISISAINSISVGEMDVIKMGKPQLPNTSLINWKLNPRPAYESLWIGILMK